MGEALPKGKERIGNHKHTGPFRFPIAFFLTQATPPSDLGDDLARMGYINRLGFDLARFREIADMSALASGPPTPVALRKDGDHLVIEWNDGHRSVYAWTHLRKNCPCAGCREERKKPPDPFRILKPNEMVPLKPLAHAAGRPLRLQDRLERRPRHRHLHPRTPARAVPVPGMPRETH